MKMYELLFDREFKKSLTKLDKPTRDRILNKVFQLEKFPELGKHLIGIDIWTEGSGDNRLDAFVENAKIEGVADRVEIQNEDVRYLPYDDDTFDVIISGLTIHHLGFDTEKAFGEMTRVLKPGGWLAIYDDPSTVFYCAKLMQKYGLKTEKKSMDMLFGVKPHLPKSK